MRSPKNGTIVERKIFVYHVTIVIGSIWLKKTVNYIIGLALNPQCWKRYHCYLWLNSETPILMILTENWVKIDTKIWHFLTKLICKNFTSIPEDMKIIFHLFRRILWNFRIYARSVCSLEPVKKIALTQIWVKISKIKSWPYRNLGN